jgi:23S rRNA G2069 N7-methylase RlmK/C1962 C5-methylase RlmI
VSIAEMLANRVRKNARHLGKWARRTGTTCWRVYDRDIPEVPVTIDTYDGDLVVADYRIDAGDRGWLDDIVAAARHALDAREAFVKRHERLVDRRAGHQYERGAEDAWRVVAEGGHRFRCNLGGYLDTGLFLDHRITRARVAAEPCATMLNLFAYTGAFTVYAAAAGMQTTTVDLSATYLAWARENLELNGLAGELVRADAIEFLADARRAGRRWELAVVDPPTFSNSKRMDGTFDVQRDHVALLDAVAAVTTKIIWFSTNRRRFRFEWQRADATIVDETHATISPDFRDPRVHRAWRIAS